VWRECRLMLLVVNVQTPVGSEVLFISEHNFINYNFVSFNLLCKKEQTNSRLFLSGVLITDTHWIIDFWDVTPCSFVNGCERLKETICART
jgi:hypothetical protein